MPRASPHQRPGRSTPGVSRQIRCALDRCLSDADRTRSLRDDAHRVRRRCGWGFQQLACTANQHGRMCCPDRDRAVTPLYDIPVMTIDGEAITLERYRGKAMLIVNVASRCGFTPQYAGL